MRLTEEEDCKQVQVLQSFVSTAPASAGWCCRMQTALLDKLSPAVGFCSDSSSNCLGQNSAAI